jgi:hypothetical protein
LLHDVLEDKLEEVVWQVLHFTLCYEVGLH